MLHFHHIRMCHPKNYQNYFYHYYFSHFLPLLLNSERKSGKDLEMTGKCAIFRFFRYYLLLFCEKWRIFAKVR
jgi:hypothetical protein